MTAWHSKKKNLGELLAGEMGEFQQNQESP